MQCLVFTLYMLKRFLIVLLLHPIVFTQVIPNDGIDHCEEARAATSSQSEAPLASAHQGSAAFELLSAC